ncbi:MAG TPA: hypothetical protein VKR32_09545, partial [Puia sp.]|nr:hypothetical protein [Puia sp.]
NDLIVFVVFVYLLLLVTGKVKLAGSAQEKFNLLMQKRGKFLRIVVLAGTILFAVLILMELFASKS